MFYDAYKSYKYFTQCKFLHEIIEKPIKWVISQLFRRPMRQVVKRFPELQSNPYPKNEACLVVGLQIARAAVHPLHAPFITDSRVASCNRPRRPARVTATDRRPVPRFFFFVIITIHIPVLIQSVYPGTLVGAM